MKYLNCILIISLLFVGTFQISKSESQEIRNTLCNVENGGLISDSTKESYQSWSDSQDEMWGANQLALSQDDNNSYEYTESLQKVLKPLIVFVLCILFCIIGFFWYTLCGLCCCSRCCQSQKRYGKGECGWVWPFVGLTVSSLGLIIISIIGISGAAGIKTSYNQVYCTGSKAMDEIMYGQDGGEFEGLQAMIDSLQNFVDTELGDIFEELDKEYSSEKNVDNFDDQDSDINELFGYMVEKCTSGSADCCDAMTSGTSSSSTFCNNGDWNIQDNLKFVYTTDFTDFDGGQSTANSVYFNTAFDTYDSYWDGRVDVQKQIWNEIYPDMREALVDMNTQAYNMAQEGQEKYVADMQQGIDDAKQLIEDFGKYQYDIRDNQEDYSSYMDLATTIIQIFYIVFIVIAALLFVLAIYLMRKQGGSCARFGFHFIWFFFLLVALLTSIIGLVFTFVGIGGQQVCSFYNGYITIETEWEYYNSLNIINQDIAEKFFICSRYLNTVDSKYKGDATITKVIDGLDSTIDEISKLGTSMENFKEKLSEGSENIQKLDELVVQAQEIIIELEKAHNYQQWNVYGSDGDYLQERADIQDAKDHFENDTSCSVSSGNDILSFDDCDGASHIMDFDNRNDVSVVTYCFPINQIEIYEDGNGIRYDEGGCDESKAVIEALDAQIKQGDGLFKQKDNMVDTYGQFITDFKSGFKGEIKGILEVIGVIEGSIDIITGDDGLIKSVNCFFLGDILIDLYDTLCPGVVYTFYKLGDNLGYFAWSLLFSAFFIFFALRRIQANMVHDKKEQNYVEDYERIKQGPAKTSYNDTPYAGEQAKY